MEEARSARGGAFQALDSKQMESRYVGGGLGRIGRRWRRPAVRGVRKNRYREATRTLQSGVPDNLRGCWSRLYPNASRSKYQSIYIIKIKSIKSMDPPCSALSHAAPSPLRGTFPSPVHSLPLPHPFYPRCYHPLSVASSSEV